MKKKILVILIGLILCVGAAFGIEQLLPYSYQVDLNQVEGLMTDGDEKNIIYRLAQTGGMDEFYDEDFDGDFSEEMDEFYDEDFDGDFSEEMDEFYEESYEDPVYQMSFIIEGKPASVRLTSIGNEGGQILAITPEGETEVWLETTGSSQITIPVTTRDAQITVQFSDPSQIIEEIRVELSEGFNAKRLLVLAVTICALFLLVILRGLIAKHIEYGFLIVGIAVSLLLAILCPTNVWWDEEIHYSDAVKGSYLAEEILSGKDLRLVLSETGLSCVNYAVSSLSIALGRLLHLSDNAGLLMDRILNAALYLGVCFMAIRIIKRYKRSLTVIALLPLSLFIGISYSYDMTINAFSFLAIALIVNEFVTPTEKLKMKNAAWIVLSLVIASLPKAVYIPIILLMLFLPASKFEGRKQHIGYKAGVVLVLGMVMLAFAVPMIYEPTIYIDGRGSGDYSTSQISVILGDLPGYLQLLVSTMWAQIYSNFIVMPNFLAMLGGASQTMCILTGLFMFFVFFTDNDHEVALPHPTFVQKGAMSIAIFGVMALVYTVFYVAFSEIGGSLIDGVQGRYFLPLLPLLAVVVQPRSIENRMNKKIYHPVILSVSLIVSVILIFQLVLPYNKVF